MPRRERLESTDRLLELSLRAYPSSSPGLVPGDGDVNESLEEVTLVRRRSTPGVLELFVRGEILAGADELDSRPIRRLELLRLPPGRRTCGAEWRGRTRSARCGRRTASRATGTTARTLRAAPRRAGLAGGDNAAERRRSHRCSGRARSPRRRPGPCESCLEGCPRPAQLGRIPRRDPSNETLGRGTLPAVATILLCGVEVYFRGKLEALLPGHHFVTSDSADWPDLVIADISRVDPDDVADS